MVPSAALLPLMETDMRKNVRVAVAAGSLALALGIGVFAGAAWARQEHMDAALSDLQSARSELQEAMHDKGGHRAAAIRDIDDAIGEVRAGIEAGR